MKNGLTIIFALLTLTASAQSSDSLQVNNNNIPLVSAVNLNILYVGIDNPIMAAVPNYGCEDLYITATNGTLRGSGCKYMIKPKKIGLTEILVSTVKNKDTIILGKLPFRIKPIPVPTAFFCNKKTGDVIDKYAAKDCKGLSLSFEDFDFDFSIRVAKYDLVVYHKYSKPLRLTSNEPRLTDPMIEALKQIDTGDVILFENIESLAPNGTLWEIEDLRLIVK